MSRRAPIRRTIQRASSSVTLHDTPRAKNTKRATNRRVNGVNGSRPHDTTHYVRGGTPCDPAPPPFTLAAYGEGSVYTLVLLRHGESEWNLSNKYTGWCDVNLTDKGRTEARTAGRLLQENGIEIDHAFTSILKRAGASANMCLNAAGQHWVPITKTWRLNERHYGALQGYNKETAYQDLGIDQEVVMQMRRSYGSRPPLMDNDHPHWHGNDRRYASLSPEQLEATRGESLQDTAKRVMPFYDSMVKSSLQAGHKCLIVSHANTLRTLIKQIDNICDEGIKGMSIPTGIPMLYRLDKHLKPVDPDIDLEFRYMVEPKGYTWGTSRNHGFHGVYLGDLERLQDIQRKRDSSNRDWQRIILRNLVRDLDAQTDGDGVVETRQLWWRVHDKMSSDKEFSNMLLLGRAADHLERLMVPLRGRRCKYLTVKGFLNIIDKVHMDAEGRVVEPFVEVGSSYKVRPNWIEGIMDLELEAECLIK